MPRLGSAAAPTLGVTATLFLLWLLAALQAGPDGPAAAALDPGRAGSIGAWWAGVQLTLAVAIALVMPELRVLALAPAALMAGEVGDLHLQVGHLLGALTGGRLIELKVLATLALGAVCVGVSVQLRHRFCLNWLIAALLMGGAASVLFEVCPGPSAGRSWWVAAEEWSELVVYSFLAASILSIAIKSQFGTNSRREAGEIGGGQSVPGI